MTFILSPFFSFKFIYLPQMKFLGIRNKACPSFSAPTSILFSSSSNTPLYHSFISSPSLCHLLFCSSISPIIQMKFGKEFRIHLEETLPEWRDKFLSYKPLKKLLKNISPAADAPSVAPLRSNIEEAQPWIGLEEWFVRILDEELEKFNDFYIDKEEDFVIRLQELKERIERVKERSSKSGVLTSESEFSEGMLNIRKDFVTVHGEMVLLKNYSSLNFAGLVKILKKYDKRTGGLLRLPFTQRALHQPFFTTDPLTRLVRECEANLELLFPLEAEVIEPNPQNQTSTCKNTNANAPESSSLQEDTMDIYRSTLAAMRAIQGLRKASSTYNPLSFASFFQNQDEDGTGDVTDENSVSSSSVALQKGESEQEDAQTNREVPEGGLQDPNSLKFAWESDAGYSWAPEAFEFVKLQQQVTNLWSENCAVWLTCRVIVLGPL